MKKIIYLSLVVATVSIAMSSCKKQLEVDPRQSIEPNEVFNSRDNINAAISGVYARLKNNRLYGRDLIAVSEALSENGLATNKSGRLVNEAANVFGAHFSNFQQDYYAIAEINTLVNGIPGVNLTPAITTSERNNWLAQLYFLRALFYHDLARTYCYEPRLGVAGQDRGGLPIVLSTPTSIQAATVNLPARPTVDSMYRRIYMDLDSAIAKFPAISNSVSAAVANSLSAHALYARVALYNRDYVKAANMASMVLSVASGRLNSVSSYIAGWSSQVHSESIFELRFANPAENIGVNESLQTTYTTLFERGNPARLQGFGDLVPQPALLSLLGFTGLPVNSAGAIQNLGSFGGRTDDVRNLLYETGNSGRGQARLECTKFIGKNGIANLDNIPLIRLSEILLTRAEARSQATNGDGTANTNFSLSSAQADLVLLKQNRYANYATTQATFDAGLTTTATIFNEVLRQRRLELANEGHRWFDFKRTGGYTGTGVGSKIVYNTITLLPGLPQREIDGNPNLQQNFGY
jgi:starch-binding outer membrane protein, SusD/RagB family